MKLDLKSIKASYDQSEVLLTQKSTDYKNFSGEEHFIYFAYQISSEIFSRVYQRYFFKNGLSERKCFSSKDLTGTTGMIPMESLDLTLLQFRSSYGSTSSFPVLSLIKYVSNTNAKRQAYI